MCGNWFTCDGTFETLFGSWNWYGVNITGVMCQGKCGVFGSCTSQVYVRTATSINFLGEVKSGSGCLQTNIVRDGGCVLKTIHTAKKSASPQILSSEGVKIENPPAASLPQRPAVTIN